MKRLIESFPDAKIKVKELRKKFEKSKKKIQRKIQEKINHN